MKERESLFKLVTATCKQQQFSGLMVTIQGVRPAEVVGVIETQMETGSEREILRGMWGILFSSCKNKTFLFGHCDSRSQHVTTH